MDKASKVLITGASGMIGGLVLQHCLADPAVGEVVSFVRRPSGSSNPKLQEVFLENFTDYTGLEPHFEGVSAAYFCLGVYTGQVPDPEFRTITVDYTVAFAGALQAGSPQARFCFLSGQGADRSGKSRVAFARYKGMAENRLLDILKEVYIFRPAYIYPVAKRREPNLAYRLMRALYPLIRGLGPRFSIRSTELAHAMYRAGMTGWEENTLENADILRLALK